MPPLSEIVSLLIKHAITYGLTIIIWELKLVVFHTYAALS